MRYSIERFVWQLSYVIFTKISVNDKRCKMCISHTKKEQKKLLHLLMNYTYNLIKIFGNSVGISFKPTPRHDKVNSSTLPEH